MPDNSADVYGYGTIACGKLYATTVGHVPGSQLGVYETQLDQSADGFEVYTRVALTDLRCFAVGTTI